MSICDACGKRGVICTEGVTDFSVKESGGLVVQAFLCQGCRDHLRAAVRAYLALDEGQVRHTCS